jgi:hypothetical protein
MTLFYSYLGAFLIGFVGALVIVWLRFVGTLPRFSSTIEIKSCEEEYEGLSTVMSRRVKDGEDLREPEVQHSDNLRKDIWKQRWAGFGISTIIYPISGEYQHIFL